MSKITDTLIATDFPSFVRECHKICRGGKALNNDPYLLLTFAMAEDIPYSFRQSARDQTRLNAEQWLTDPMANAEIETRLAKHGIDEGSIDAEVLIQSRELFIMFDNLMQSAQSRRILLLREINRRRISLEFEHAGAPKRRISAVTM